MGATEGWVKPWGIKEYHYYKSDGVSLCRKWFLFDVHKHNPGVSNQTGECVACRRKLDILLRKEGEKCHSQYVSLRQ